jgi:hypothetical protein
VRALVVYESMFGNTELAARAVAEGLSGRLTVTVTNVATGPAVSGTDLLVVGAPTHAFSLSRPGTRSSAVQQGGAATALDVGVREWLARAAGLDGVRTAAFDTKVARPKLPGSAARGAARRLRRLGGRPVVPPASFYVAGTPGPLVDGELDRARRWGRLIAATMLTSLPAG